MDKEWRGSYQKKNSHLMTDKSKFDELVTPFVIAQLTTAPSAGTAQEAWTELLERRHRPYARNLHNKYHATGALSVPCPARRNKFTNLHFHWLSRRTANSDRSSSAWDGEPVRIEKALNIACTDFPVRSLWRVNPSSEFYCQPHGVPNLEPTSRFVRLGAVPSIGLFRF